MAATRGDLDGIQFGVLTDEQIRALAVVEVTESTLHTKGQPKAGGPIDTRFGTCSRFQLCGTCKNSVQTCPGHPGYISLPYPLPHVAFIGYLTRFLNVFCFNCSHFLLPPDSIPNTARTAKTRLAFAYEEARKARSRKRNPLICLNPECNLPQPTVYVEEPFVKLAWRDDAYKQFLQEEEDDTVVAAPKPRKRKKTDAPVDVAEPVDTPEQRAWREQRQADYDFFVTRPFNNWDAYNVLRSIRKVDLTILGIDGDKTHPSGFMLLSVLVPPMGVRPTVSFEEGSKRCGYNQLTKKISEIVKTKRALLIDAADAKVSLEEAATELPDNVKTAVQLLYVTISHYMIKDKCKVPGLKMSPYAARAHARAQSVSAALNGKKGRYRDTLMGKRVNFCLRTVVTTDPDADLDEIGLPEELARRLTVPIRVTRHNREALQQLMREDGVMQVMDESSGDMIAVTEHNRDKMVLLDGWVVERYVRNGDWIPINRQPTLHRPSIMGHRVRIHKDRTLKLPAPCTTPYNADHDGDEMNGHIPQTPEARAEVQELMAVSKHIMHPRANKPVMAIIQDGIDAAYFITHMDTFFDRGEAMELLMALRYDRDASRELPLGHAESYWTTPCLPPPAIWKPKPQWTGKQLISCVIPRLNMVRKLKNRTRFGDDSDHMAYDGTLLIRNGELLRGTLCKQSMGDAAGGIIHMACLYLGNNVAARFISDVQRLLNKFLISMGFSVGVKDCITDPAVRDKVQLVLAGAERHILQLQELARLMPQDPEIQDMAESQIGNTLKSLSSMIGNVVRANLDESNMFNIMANICGSKGSSFNLAQIMGMVGQTFVNGLRPVASGTGRMLPSAPLPGQDPLSLLEQLKTHGLIERPYKAGLSMPAAFLHNMGGREGLVDTAAKTSRTGYLQRRAVKAMESHHVGYDNTIRDAYQNIFQMCFGTDGLDTTRLCKVEMPSLLLDNAQLRHRCIATAAHSDEWIKLLLLRDEIRRCKDTNFQRNLRQNLDTYLPFSLPMLIDMQKQTCSCLVVATPAQCFDSVNRMCTTLDGEMPSTYTCYHVRDELGSGRVQNHWRLCISCVDVLCQRVLDMHRDARLQPGEGIGAMTATSIGEPCTQMSAEYHTEVLVCHDGRVQSVSIGQLIDNLLPEGTAMQHVVQPVDNLFCPGVSATEKVQWVPITHISRHPVNGDMMQVTTRSGRTLCMTPSHSFLVRHNNRVVPRPGSMLTLNDALPIVQHMPDCLLAMNTDNKSDVGATSWDILKDKDASATYIRTEWTNCGMMQDNMVYFNTQHHFLLALALARFNITADFVDEHVRVHAHCYKAFSNLVHLQVELHVAPNSHIIPGVQLSFLTSFVQQESQLFTVDQLLRIRDAAVHEGVPTTLLAELDSTLAADVFWDPIINLSIRPGGVAELVYDFTVDQACQSFMLTNGVFVHNTLNSVSWESKIRLFTQQPDATIKNAIVDIGAFVDGEMAARPQDVLHQDDQAEWIALKQPTKILSVDLNGSWSYELVEGVSRHPVCNKDGSETVLRVTTLAGRQVIATKGESFLRYCRVPYVSNDEKYFSFFAHHNQSPLSFSERLQAFEAAASYQPECIAETISDLTKLEIIKGSDLKIGDFLPAAVQTQVLRRPQCQNETEIPFNADKNAVLAQFHNKWNSTRLVDAQLSADHTFRFKADMVVSIEELPCPPVGLNGTAGKMYDLTVANTRNFVLANGLAVRDTFHQAGAAKAGMTDGVPRMREIICASRTISTPFMTLPLKKAFSQDKHTAEMLARGLPFTLLRSILTSTDTLYEPDLMTSHMMSDVPLVQQHLPFLEYVQDRCSHWVIRFELCRNRTGARSLEPRGVGDLIQEYLADMGLVIASRPEDPIWVIRVYMVGVERSVDQTLKKSLDGNSNRPRSARTSMQRTSITSRKRRKFADLSQLPQLEGEADRLTPVPLHRIDPAIGKTIHTARDVIEWMLARNTQQDLKNELRVCGIPDVESAMVRKTDRTDVHPVTGAVQVVEEWVVDVKGSNFTQLAMLHVVDMAHIMSNHVMVIYDTLGIDAAAHVLFQELQMVLLTSGSRVDDRLIKLLVDVMTHHGFVMPISRHGLNRLVEHGVLAKITFEETLEMLFEAAALGHFDPLLGVSENIMVGRQPTLGTNLSKMFIERNGQKVPCLRNTRDQTTAVPDTRMIVSVVTENEETGSEETADGMADWEHSLDRILIARNVEDAQGIRAGQGELTDQSLYKQLFYHGHRPAPPVTKVFENNVPFRPSSPPMWDMDIAINQVCSFRPSSPTCDE